MDLNGSTILENEPINSVIGTLSAVDPDSNGTFFFELVDENQTFPDHEFFTIEPNGSLVSSSVFDYEGNQTSFTLNIQVADENNGTFSKSFIISVLNVVEDFDLDGIEDAYDPDDDNDGFSDLDELAYGSDPFDDKSVANASPYAIELNNSLVLETLPIGSLIGEFNSSDPDANATLTYRLVSGDNSNSLFTVDANGTLKTSTIFDYENNATSFNITVQVLDEFNASVEGNFTIVLLDVYEPQEPNHFVDLNSSVDLEMIWVEPGTFIMGSPDTEVGRQSDREDEHNVTLTRGFYLGKYEVTQAQYEAVMYGNSFNLSSSPSRWGDNINRPVEKVSWHDAQVFLSVLNTKELNGGCLPNGWRYILPTESQWEYSCRAGTTTTYSWGNEINSTYANYSSSKSNVVGLNDSNPWGFFDMHGNVYEWTADWFSSAYPNGNPSIDPIGPTYGHFKSCSWW